MLDIKLIRKERAWVEEKIRTKEPDLDLSEVVELDDNIRSVKIQVETLKAQRNDSSKKIGEEKKAGKDTAALMENVREMGEKISALDNELKKLEEDFQNSLAKIPNIPADDVKVSQDIKENVCIKTVGEKRSFDFEPKNHLELNEKLHLLEFQKTAITTGSGWPAYRGMGARLEWALLSYMIDMQLLNGFEFWLPPVLVKQPMMFGSGQIPKFDGQYYQVDDKEQLYLIPTAEVVLNGLHHGEIIPKEKLPLKYAAYTPCFRKEAGAAGAQERGLIRVHQFNKVEMFAFTTPEQSETLFAEMLGVAEQILEGLGLHYRLCNLVTGDMSFTAAKTVDVEVWLPGQNRYYEVSSISNCTDYQARRSHIRYRTASEKPALVHTLNGSGLATPRLLVALLENNQNSDGSVNLPPVLQEKLGVKKLIPEG